MVKGLLAQIAIYGLFRVCKACTLSSFPHPDHFSPFLSYCSPSGSLDCWDIWLHIIRLWPLTFSHIRNLTLTLPHLCLAFVQCHLHNDTYFEDLIQNCDQVSSSFPKPSSIPLVLTWIHYFTNMNRSWIHWSVFFVSIGMIISLYC